MLPYVILLSLHSSISSSVLLFMPIFLPISASLLFYFSVAAQRYFPGHDDSTRYFYIDFLKVHYSARKTTPSLRGKKYMYIYIYKKNEKKLKIHMQSQYYWCIRQIGDRDSIKYYNVWNTGSCMDGWSSTLSTRRCIGGHVWDRFNGMEWSKN